MGGGPGWWRGSYHEFHEETVGAYNSFKGSEEHNRRVINSLNRLYQVLGYEQERIQTKAFKDELTELLKKQDLEWSIFQEEVRKAQATFISNYYTNRIIAELGNLNEIVNEK
jgi:hypothetical protein